VHVTADWRFTAPDLFLPRTSILSVFSTEQRNDVGGGIRYEFERGLEAGVDAHLAIEPGEEDGNYIGADTEAELVWRRGTSQAGVEVSYLDTLENGWFGGRLFGRRDFGSRLFASADVMTHFFREDVNGQGTAVTGTLTAGLKLARGFNAVLSGRAGMTPYLEQAFDVMVKLVYNQTYVAKEVR
jgi:subtilisin family serine protease